MLGRCEDLGAASLTVDVGWLAQRFWGEGAGYDGGGKGKLPLLKIGLS